jgi:mannose-1-phosphate guanylyltransferase
MAGAFGSGLAKNCKMQDSASPDPENVARIRVCRHMSQIRGSGNLWSMVLSGGDGARIKPFIQCWLGRHRPKQYCTFVGTRSLLQHTVDRASRLTLPEHIVVVIDRTHLQDASAQLCNRPVRLAVQPCNRDTAAGILLPLTYIRAADPQATVAIFPSDHFVHPEDRFIRAVGNAVEEASRLPDRLILMGVEPDCAETDYGWIQPGDLLPGTDNKVCAVRAFIEKPSRSEAQEILESGALWNTFILVAKAECVWRLGYDCLPEIMPLFNILADAIGSSTEAETLGHIYSRMPALNFSSDFLQRIPGHIAVMTLQGVSWSDWGRPARIVHSLRSIHKEPAFSQNMWEDQTLANQLVPFLSRESPVSRHS